MQQWLRPRPLAACCLLLCIALLVGALILQHYWHLIPCPLCMLQRYFFLAIACLFAFIFVFNKPLCIKLGSAALALFSLLGAAVALRQIVLQNTPSNAMASCGPDLDYMLANFPFHEALRLLYQGSGDCAHSQWQLLGLSLAAWSLLAFIFFALVGVFLSARKPT